MRVLGALRFFASSPLAFDTVLFAAIDTRSPNEMQPCKGGKWQRTSVLQSEWQTLFLFTISRPSTAASNVFLSYLPNGSRCCPIARAVDHVPVLMVCCRTCQDTYDSHMTVDSTPSQYGKFLKLLFLNQTNLHFLSCGRLCAFEFLKSLTRSSVENRSFELKSSTFCQKVLSVFANEPNGHSEESTLQTEFFLINRIYEVYLINTIY